MLNVTAPPSHVLAAFGIAADGGRLLGGVGRRAWRYGDAVVKPVRDPVSATWVSGLFESLRISSLRIPRPLRSLDGRWVVSGWSAQRYVAGRPAPRYREMLSVARELHRALAGVPQPRFLREDEGLSARVDRGVWSDPAGFGATLPGGHGRTSFLALADELGPCTQPSQVVHADLFGNVLFAGSAPPAVVDFVPLWRPPGFAEAVLIADAIAWGGAGADLLGDWDVPERGELLARALAYRLALALLHPRSTPRAVVGILTAIDVTRPVRG